MNLETMQRDGREGIKQQHNFEILFGAGSMAEKSCESYLDQHTADTWKAAQESMKKSILESGLLEEDTDPTWGEGFNDGIKTGHNTAVRDIKEFISNMDKV